MINNSYSCLIVDDELLARNLLKQFVGRLSYLHLLGECSNAIEATEAIHKHQPDIIFLDITMPEMNGIELLQTFTAANRPEVIITTSHRDYAVEGYQYDVSDYLLKPIAFERFLRAVNKATGRIRGTVPREEPKEEFSLPSGQFFFIKEGKKTLQVNAEEVVYVEGMKDYVKIHLTDRVIISYMTMAKMEELLPPGMFLRINRSYIIRMKAVKSIDGNTVEMISKRQLVIGTSYRDAVREAIHANFIGRR